MNDDPYWPDINERCGEPLSSFRDQRPSCTSDKRSGPDKPDLTAAKSPWHERGEQLESEQGAYASYAAWEEWFAANEMDTTDILGDLDGIEKAHLYRLFEHAVEQSKLATAEVTARPPATRSVAGSVREAKADAVETQEPPPSLCVPSDPQAQLALSATNKIREARHEGRGLVTMFECEASALIAQYNEQLSESISYTETVDAMLDGIIPTRKDPKDPTSQPLWLKERLQLLLDQLEDTADKLSGVWLHLDSWARGEAPSLEFVKDAAASILRHQKVPGWKDADLQRKAEGEVASAPHPPGEDVTL